jgi:cytochrome c553
MIRALCCAAVVAITVTAPSAMADGDVENGRLQSQTCMGCHGAPGLRNAYPGYRVPKLGGQHAEYIVAALQAYKAQLRSHPTMQAQAADLSEKDMADIGAYFSSLKDISTE